MKMGLSVQAMKILTSKTLSINKLLVPQSVHNLHLQYGIRIAKLTFIESAQATMSSRGGNGDCLFLTYQTVQPSLN